MPKYKFLAGILGSLPVFESATRFMSFTKAANELCLTQPAVSRRISSLENHLGVTVFERRHNKLQLTNEGRQILAAVKLILGHLDKVFGQISEEGRQNKLTIACGFSFANMWLQPRFTKLRQLMDSTEFHLIATESLDDLNPDSIDIRILWINNPWQNRDVRPLFSLNLIPVCSPAFASKHNLSCADQNIVQRLSSLPLLQCGSGGSADIDWAQWFNLQNTPYSEPESTYVYDNFQYLIQGAIDSEGIALGHHYLIEALLKCGDLIKIGPVVQTSDVIAWIEINSNSISKDVRDNIFKWFLHSSTL